VQIYDLLICSASSKNNIFTFHCCHFSFAWKGDFFQPEGWSI